MSLNRNEVRAVSGPLPRPRLPMVRSKLKVRQEGFFGINGTHRARALTTRSANFALHEAKCDLYCTHGGERQEQTPRKVHFF